MIYFISDFHLEAKKTKTSWEREKKIIRFLNTIESKATQIFLLGDIFDFWFEYKSVIPKGYIRFLGKLAALSDKGIELHYFCGNHDMWLRDYFTKELNIKIYYQPQEMLLGNKKFFIGHGDGLGPGSYLYKILRLLLFKNKMAYWVYINLIPPDWSMPLGRLWSEHSRKKQTKYALRFKTYLGDKKEWLTQFCLQQLKINQIDFFIFGHRHLPIKKKLNVNSYYFNTGDWLQDFSYLEYDYNKIELKFFNE